MRTQATLLFGPPQVNEVAVSSLGRVVWAVVHTTLLSPRLFRPSGEVSGDYTAPWDCQGRGLIPGQLLSGLMVTGTMLSANISWQCDEQNPSQPPRTCALSSTDTVKNGEALEFDKNYFVTLYKTQNETVAGSGLGTTSSLTEMSMDMNYCPLKHLHCKAAFFEALQSLSKQHGRTWLKLRFPRACSRSSFLLCLGFHVYLFQYHFMRHIKFRSQVVLACRAGT